MKKTKILICLLAMIFILNGCVCISGSGNIVMEKREVENFTGIELRGQGNLYLQQGPDITVIVEAEDNLLGKIDTYVENGVLIIEPQNFSCLRGHKVFNYHVQVVDLDKIKIVGSGDVLGQERLESTDLGLEIVGSGDMYLEVEAETINSNISGSGDIEIAGNADEHKMVISGSGNLLALDFETRTSAVDIIGSGSAKVNALNELDINISGSGNVIYKGNAQPKTSISGTGSVSKF